VLVVDGSPRAVFAEHDAVWSPMCRHATVDRSFGYLNDKVNGIHTGVRLAAFDKVILADDDIRYGAEQIHRACDLLDEFEVVRPQNYLEPLPWWARMEAARMLINRATLRTGDYPGTCAFRRATMLRVGHYDGDVLFDNEEIIRHFARAGAKICYATDFFVLKRPTTLRKWREQRPRQAYEDFPLRAKTSLFLAIIPLAVVARVLFGRRALAIYATTLLVGSAAVAAKGRARGRAAEVFPWWICLFAPLWVIERGFSTYWAVYWFLTRGGYPFGERLLTRGVGRDWVAGGRIASAAATHQPNER
jgi:hypothetical protein